MNKKLAVTFGRFNFISKGHVNFIETVLKKWDELYLIILVPDDISMSMFYKNPATQNFLDKCKSKIHSKPLLSINYRVNAFSEVIKNNPKLQGKVHLSVSCRPDANVALFNASYPEKFFDLVFPNDDTTQLDKSKICEFEKVFFRKVYGVNPDFILHNSQIEKYHTYEQNLDAVAYQYYKDENIL